MNKTGIFQDDHAAEHHRYNTTRRHTSVADYTPESSTPAPDAQIVTPEGKPVTEH
jgi:hypothetical protein